MRFTKQQITDMIIEEKCIRLRLKQIRPQLLEIGDRTKDLRTAERIMPLTGELADELARLERRSSDLHDEEYAARLQLKILEYHLGHLSPWHPSRPSPEEVAERERELVDRLAPAIKDEMIDLLRTNWWLQDIS